MDELLKELYSMRAKVLISSPALNHLSVKDIVSALRRNFRGDFGEVSNKIKERNEQATMYGDILSEYISNKGMRFLVITKRDCTLVQMKDEYWVD